MASRREFLSGLLATGAIPAKGWAEAGSPAFLAAARRPDGRYALFGLSEQGRPRFEVPLPGRGHAAAAHPNRAEAVVFARRPGTFALVIDCFTGEIRDLLEVPVGRHCYGHGAFSSDGAWLFTTENDFDAESGRVGVWDVVRGYRRIAEWESGGIGPHDIIRLPGADLLAVANGGIATHPETGRTKLNLPDMQPNLTYLSMDGTIVESLALEGLQQWNSIRHLAVSKDGLVAFGMQWQRGSAAPPLLGLHRRGSGAKLLLAPRAEHHRMRGYVGSVAFSGDQRRVAITSPRGGRVQFFDVGTSTFLGGINEPDACGISAAKRGFAITAGTGRIIADGDAAGHGSATAYALRWDNHLVRL